MKFPEEKVRDLAEKMVRSIDGMELMELVDPLEDEDPVDVLVEIINRDPMLVMQFLAEKIEESYWENWRSERRAERV